jgi:hypothetical protein
VRTEWNQAQLYLKACGKLGGSETAILSTAQLRGGQTRWMHSEELRSRQCHLTTSEYTALTSWLPAPRESGGEESAEGLGASATEAGEALITGGEGGAACVDPSGRSRPPLMKTRATAADPAQCPSCIGGQVIGTPQHDQLVLRYSPPDCHPEADISNLPDPLLLDYLCHGRLSSPTPVTTTIP